MALGPVYRHHLTLLSIGYVRWGPDGTGNVTGCFDKSANCLWRPGSLFSVSRVQLCCYIGFVVVLFSAA